MRKRQRRLVIGFSSLLAAAGLCFGAVSPAAATVEYPPEGGTWEYGVNYWIMQVYSDYHHPSSLHNSTACDGNDACTTSKPAVPGKWSYASKRATWGGNTAYYNAG